MSNHAKDCRCRNCVLRENERLREALEGIRLHMEQVSGTASHLSTCWHIANRALEPSQ